SVHPRSSAANFTCVIGVICGRNPRTSKSTPTSPAGHSHKISISPSNQMVNMRIFENSPAAQFSKELIRGLHGPTLYSCCLRLSAMQSLLPLLLSEQAEIGFNFSSYR